MNVLKERVKLNEEKWKACLDIDCFYFISSKEFGIINQCLDGSMPLPKSSKIRNPGYHVSNILNLIGRTTNEDQTFNLASLFNDVKENGSILVISKFYKMLNAHFYDGKT